MTLPVADAWGEPALAAPSVRAEPGVGYSFETPVWPRAAGLLGDVAPRQTVVTDADPDGEYAYVKWVDESAHPPRVRVQRLVRLTETMFVHDTWIDPTPAG